MGLQAGDLATLIHELIWRQPFPNANHRTATAALMEELGISVTMDALRRLTDPLFAESKRLLDGSDTSMTNEQAKQAHHAVTARLVDALQSIR